MDRETIINTLYVGKSKRLSRNYEKLINDDMIEFLNNNYNDAHSLKEQLYQCKYNIYNRPLCKLCGKPIEFKRNHYGEYCSISCMSKYSVNKRKHTCYKRYGNETYNNDEKRKRTCINKYGIDNFISTDEFKSKRSNTMINKYGSSSCMKVPSIVSKIVLHTNYDNANIKRKKTMYERYGVDCALQLEYSRKVRKSKESLSKEYETKKRNNSFKRSNSEDRSYLYIKERFNDVIRQYISNEYPFACDFYIPSIDLYIECNYHWTHGGHSYNENDMNDINKVNEWKSKNTEYYNNAIDTWTIRDKIKRETAMKNNLSYIEFFNENDLKKYFSTLNLHSECVECV